MSYLPRRATLILLRLLAVTGSLQAAYFLLTPQLLFNRVSAVISALGFFIALAAYQRGWQWPRYAIVIGVCLGAGLLNLEPYISQRFSVTVFLASVLALVLADWRWVIASALVTYLCLLGRAGWSGIYAEPLTIGLVVVLVGGMAVARYLTDAALERAEEQTRLVEQERAGLAERVAERTQELSAANAQLLQANQMKDAFLASISHELRTPLNAILGSVELLQEEIYGPLEERQRRALGTVDESGRQLLGLINDILDLAQMEAGRLDFAFDLVAVGDICAQCARLVRGQAEAKRLGLSLDIAPDVGVISSDPKRLRQILLNLLSNAVKFTPEGGTIGLRARRLPDEGLVELTVWDTGIGIAPTDQGQLFQPFTQLDRRLARRYEGTGLGLALVSQLVDLHHGTVSVSSDPGKGSAFTVRLPVGGGGETLGEGQGGQSPP